MTGNDMVLFNNDTSLVVSDRLKGLVDEAAGDLSGGVNGSYAILSFKGSRFSIKYQGQQTPITNEQGDPVGSFEAVLVKANPYLTKQYYAKDFVEGDSAAPDCFSIDGKVPSDASPAKQHTNCAACPMNTFSKINETTGKKTKPCQDNRKMALLPADDLVNELFGGPMLARTPAASLKDLAMFGDTLKARGFSYNSVRVRIGFDLAVSYPKLVFKAIRPLTDEEADKVLEWYQSDAVAKMLADFADISVPTDAAWVADDVFEQPQPVKLPVAKPATTLAAAPTASIAKPAAPKAAAPAAPKPVVIPKAAAPAAPKAPGATFGPKAAAPKAPAPKAAAAPVTVAAAVAAAVEAGPAEDTDTTTEVVPGNLENDIAGILSELNSIAGE